MRFTNLTEHLRTLHRATKDQRFAAFGPDYKGPVIVAEGDSWFEYPFTRDCIMVLSKSYKIFCRARAGDTVAAMLAQDEVLPAVRTIMPDLVLISIGGNDIVDDLPRYVKRFASDLPRTGPAYVERSTYRRALRRLFRSMEPTCKTILDLGVDIIASGYDYPNPRDLGEGGQWIGPVLKQKRNIDDRPLWHYITKHMIDLYEIEMRAFVAAMNKGRDIGAQMSFVSGVNAVNDGSYAPDFGAINLNWNDEMHPHDAGFARLAARIADKIEQAMQRRMVPTV